MMANIYDPTLPLPVSVPCLNPKFRKVKMARKLIQDYQVDLLVDGVVWRLRVPMGYEYDASIPNLAIIRKIAGSPYDPDLEAAACVHDWIYQTNMLPRYIADRIYLALLRRAGVPEWKAWMHYRTLRAFGGRAYNVSKADAEYMRHIALDVQSRGLTMDDFRPVKVPQPELRVYPPEMEGGPA